MGDRLLGQTEVAEMNRIESAAEQVSGKPVASDNFGNAEMSR